MFGKLPSSSLSNLRTPLNTLVPKQVISQLNWTDLWRRRIISNFEYLMRLNILAGRSFNDIGQYPVFPWVLCDFKSSSINLHDPSVYRDLSKPIGALNPVRLEEFRDRFDSFDPDDHTRFMYGSHYSSAGIVLHFLLRQEPFTTLAINLQGGNYVHYLPLLIGSFMKLIPHVHIHIYVQVILIYQIVYFLIYKVLGKVVIIL